MPVTQGPPGCPPGLEYLTQIDQLIVKQKVELLEGIVLYVQNKLELNLLWFTVIVVFSCLTWFMFNPPSLTDKANSNFCNNSWRAKHMEACISSNKNSHLFSLVTGIIGCVIVLQHLLALKQITNTRSRTP